MKWVKEKPEEVARFRSRFLKAQLSGASTKRKRREAGGLRRSASNVTCGRYEGSILMTSKVSPLKRVEIENSLSGFLAPFRDAKNA